MSDTVYRAPYFGKNSDRIPSEPQTVCIVPVRQSTDSLDMGGRTFGVRDGGLAFLLSKPSWIWGGEMGVNSAGVAIGNEAVFSHFKPAKDGVLGMDILRAALGTALTAKEAVEFICEFVEAHDQGGNGAYKGSLYYDNSFLVADGNEAFIVETAGRRWAWRAASPVDAISNAYCIERDYRRLDQLTCKELAPVDDGSVCSSGGESGRLGMRESFKAKVENRFYLRFSKGEERRALSLSLLKGLQSESSIEAFIDVLRSHGPYDPRSPLSRHMKSLCVHIGGFPDSATTASLAVEYRGKGTALIWFSATPYPCLSLYKPVLLRGGEFLPLWASYDYSENSPSSLAYWERWRVWIAKPKAYNSAFDRAEGRAPCRSLDPGFAAARGQAQEALAMIADSALSDLDASGDASSLAVLSQEADSVVAGWEKDCGL